MKGSNVKKIRKATNLTRARLAEITGITYGRLRAFEAGVKDPDGDEEFALLTALHDYGQVDVNDRNEKFVEAMTAINDEPVTLTEWRGLTPGAKVRLVTDKPGGRSREFRSYYKSPTDEYVNVVLPGKASPRTVAPEDLLCRRKNRWVPVMEDEA